MEKNLRPTPSPKAGSKLCRQKRGETLSPPSRQPFPQPSQSGHDWGDAPAREGDRLNVLPPLCWLFSYRRGHEVVTLLALSPRTGVPTQRNPEMPAQACGLRTHKLSQRPQGWGDSTPRGHTTRAWLSPRGGVETTGTEWVVARDVAQHPTMRKVHPGEQPGPNVHSAPGKKPQGCHRKQVFKGNKDGVEAKERRRGCWEALESSHSGSVKGPPRTL